MVYFCQSLAEDWLFIYFDFCSRRELRLKWKRIIKVPWIFYNSVNRNNIIMISKRNQYVINLAIASKFYIRIDSVYLWVLPKNLEPKGFLFSIDSQAHYSRWVWQGILYYFKETSPRQLFPCSISWKGINTEYSVTNRSRIVG